MREIGVVNVEKAGRHDLTVKAKSKRGIAIMDLRSVVMTPVR
jgi:hypothetical protein